MHTHISFIVNIRKACKLDAQQECVKHYIDQSFLSPLLRKLGYEGVHVCERSLVVVMLYMLLHSCRVTDPKLSPVLSKHLVRQSFQSQ